MVNYQNTKIYKIESHKGPKIYIGSTTKEYLSQRMETHKGCYKYWKCGKRGKTMAYELFDEYGVQDCFITLIESFPCNSKDEVHAREAHYIKTLECVNKNIPLRTRKEYYEDNKEKVKLQSRTYAEENKERCREQLMEWRKNNAEHIKEKRVMYHRAHKEELNAHSRKYREDNKETLNARRRELYKLKKDRASSQ